MNTDQAEEGLIMQEQSSSEGSGTGRYTVFPLHGFDRDEEGRPRCFCREGRECPRIGKHPAMRWGELDAGERRYGSAGHGIVTGAKSGFFAIDTDGPDADARFRALGEVPATFTVRTPSGGRHYYFAYPGKPVRTSGGQLDWQPHEVDADGKKISTKIDVRGDGGFVVAAGSPHKSGQSYEVEHELPIAEAPAWLLAWPGLYGSDRLLAGEGEALHRVFPVDPSSDLGERRFEMGVEACKTLPPATDTSTNARWNLALHLVRDLELPLDICAQLILEHYLPRCETRWTEREVWHKLEDARDKSDRLPGDVTPIDTSKFSAPIGPDARYTKMGALLDVLGLLRGRGADGSREVDCLCGAQGRLRPSGRYRCAQGACIFRTQKDFLRAVAA